MYLSVRSPEVVHQTIDGEVVILNLEKGVYFSPDATGAWLWSLVAQGADTDEIISLATTTFPETSVARSQTEAFLSQIVDLGLVQPVDELRQTDETAQVDPPASFVEPQLQTYEDMTDLLLLDPIHDVGEEDGWPKTS